MIIGISGKLQSGKNLLGAIIQFLTENKEEIKFLKENNNTDFDIIQMYYKRQINSTNYQIKTFADKLKDIICLLIGCTREQLEDIEFKEKELGEEWWYCKKWNTGLEKYSLIPLNEAEDGLEIVKLTPRKLLQLIGTECGRNIIHPNIWVNALFSDYTYICKSQFCLASCKEPCDEDSKPYDNWVITDVRFENEAQAIKDRGGIVIRVNRDSDLRLPHLYEEFTNQGEILHWDEFYKEHPSETALDNYKDWDYVIDNNDSLESLIEKVKVILKDLKLI